MYLKPSHNIKYSIRCMTEIDVPAVHAIELDNHINPWSENIFIDCLKVGYSGYIACHDSVVFGYALMSIAANEAHILNICVAKEYQSKGIASSLLEQLLSTARVNAARSVFLEVRQSNVRALRIYERYQFNQIGKRDKYYPKDDGREDALILGLELV